MRTPKRSSGPTATGANGQPRSPVRVSLHGNTTALRWFLHFPTEAKAPGCSRAPGRAQGQPRIRRIPRRGSETLGHRLDLKATLPTPPEMAGSGAARCPPPHFVLIPRREVGEPVGCCCCVCRLSSEQRGPELRRPAACPTCSSQPRASPSPSPWSVASAHEGGLQRLRRFHTLSTRAGMGALCPDSLPSRPEGSIWDARVRESKFASPAPLHCV